MAVRTSSNVRNKLFMPRINNKEAVTHQPGMASLNYTTDFQLQQYIALVMGVDCM